VCIVCDIETEIGGRKQSEKIIKLISETNKHYSGGCMNVTALFKLSLVVVIIAALTGCAKPPQEKVDLAKTAVQVAEQAQADVYVAEKFNAVKDSLNQALAEIEKENGRFGLMRNYNHAAKTLDAVKALSEQAASDAAVRKEEVKNEVNTLLAQAKTEIDATKALLKKAPRGKEGKAAVQAMEEEVATVESSLVQVAELVTAENYLAAKDKVSAAIEKVTMIKNEVQAAIDKKKGKR